MPLLSIVEKRLTVRAMAAWQTCGRPNQVAAQTTVAA
jgi:hypothetical protein